jgi:hypothetical protein
VIAAAGDGVAMASDDRIDFADVVRLFVRL